MKTKLAITLTGTLLIFFVGSCVVRDDRQFCNGFDVQRIARMTPCERVIGGEDSGVFRYRPTAPPLLSAALQHAISNLEETPFDWSDIPSSGVLWSQVWETEHPHQAFIAQSVRHTNLVTVFRCKKDASGNYQTFGNDRLIAVLERN